MAVTSDSIRKIIRASPFKPFRIFLADQRTIDVKHPEFACIAQTGRELCVHQPDGDLERIDPLLIVSIADLDDQGRAMRPPESGQAA